jgi:hypothetical protein
MTKILLATNSLFYLFIYFFYLLLLTVIIFFAFIILIYFVFLLLYIYPFEAYKLRTIEEHVKIAPTNGILLKEYYDHQNWKSIICIEH